MFKFVPERLGHGAAMYVTGRLQDEKKYLAEKQEADQVWRLELWSPPCTSRIAGIFSHEVPMISHV